MKKAVVLAVVLCIAVQGQVDFISQPIPATQEIIDLASNADFGPWKDATGRVQGMCDVVKDILQDEMNVTFSRYDAQIYHNISVESINLHRVWVDIGGPEGYLELVLRQRYVMIENPESPGGYLVKSPIDLIQAEWVVEEFRPWRDATEAVQRIVEEQRGALGCSQHDYNYSNDFNFLGINCGSTTKLDAIRYQSYQYRRGMYYQIEFKVDDWARFMMLVDKHLPDTYPYPYPSFLSGPNLLEELPGLNIPLCHLQHLTVDQFKREYPEARGVFDPDCRDDLFEPKQCKPSNDCWCVDMVTGQVIDGTFMDAYSQNIPFGPLQCPEVPDGAAPILLEDQRTFSDWMTADDNIQRICDAVKGDLDASLNVNNTSRWSKYEAVEYQIDSQYYGKHYVIKVDVGDDRFMILDVFQSYPVPDAQLSLLGSSTGGYIDWTPCRIETDPTGYGSGYGPGYGLEQMFYPDFINPPNHLAECVPDGRYNSTRCSPDSEACWCVDQDTGHWIESSIRPLSSPVNCEKIIANDDNNEGTEDGNQTDEDLPCFWKVFKEVILRQVQDYHH